MVWIGKTHPAEPVGIGRQRIEPGDGAVGDPVGVIMLARDRVVLDLHRIGIAAAVAVLLELHGDQPIEAVDFFGMGLRHPLGVVQKAARDVAGQLHMIKAAMRAKLPELGHAVFVELEFAVDERLEMGFADQRSLVAGLVLQIARHRRRIGWQRHAVHPNPVRAHVLAGDHGGAGWHTDHALAIGAVVDHAFAGPAVDGRRARDLTAVAAQSVVTLLVGRYEQDLASHCCSNAFRDDRLRC